MFHDLPNSLEAHLLIQVRDVLRKHVSDCDVWVFGSRVSNKAKRFSDLDLAVVSPSVLPLRRLVLLANAFEESDLPIKVDLVDWHSAGAAFRDRIAERHEVIFQAENPSHPESQ